MRLTGQGGFASRMDHVALAKENPKCTAHCSTKLFRSSVTPHPPSEFSYFLLFPPFLVGAGLPRAASRFLASFASISARLTAS